MRGRIALAAVVSAAIAALAAPSGASAADPNCVPLGGTQQECTFRVPITVGGYEVLQSANLTPRPSDHGFITKMETDIVDGDGTPVPISRLMLHHIVFVNISRPDRTCSDILFWDNASRIQSGERFYAAGEERAKLALPPGYGYRSNNNPWGLIYMVMNHRSALDSAYIQYKLTLDTDPTIKEVHPYWLDVENCNADPQYTVPGTGGPGSVHLRSSDITMPESGRIVAGGGHVHGGAHRLAITEPDCGNRQIADSVPTWGNPDHPFYNVRPILHEPGPVSMSAFTTPTGIPVRAGERVRLNSIYDNSTPHMRVMGISLIYLAPDGGVVDACGPIPGDVTTLTGSQLGRSGPVPFKVPLTGLNSSGQAVEINAPPGKLKKLSGKKRKKGKRGKKKKKGGTIRVGDGYTFSRPNVQIRRGKRLRWLFTGDLHNLTLANGPEGFASPNLNSNRTFDIRFKRPGTYRFFCSLHPVSMSQRVVVKKKGKKTGGKRRGKGKRA